MKRKTFVFSLLGIWLVMLISGLYSDNVVFIKTILAFIIVPVLLAVGYMNSLIPRKYRLVDMNEPMKITDFTEVN